MATIGTCIKTGAVVRFIEYGQAVVSDLFAVGNTVVIRFAPGVIGNSMYIGIPREVTHEAYIGSQGFLDAASGMAVTQDCWIEEVKQ